LLCKWKTATNASMRSNTGWCHWTLTGRMLLQVPPAQPRCNGEATQRSTNPSSAKPCGESCTASGLSASSHVWTSCVICSYVTTSASQQRMSRQRSCGSAQKFAHARSCATARCGLLVIAAGHVGATSSEPPGLGGANGSRHGSESYNPPEATTIWSGHLV